MNEIEEKIVKYSTGSPKEPWAIVEHVSKELDIGEEEVKETLRALTKTDKIRFTSVGKLVKKGGDADE